MRGLSLRGFYEYKKTDYRKADEELRSDTHNNEVGAELKFRGNAVVKGFVKYTYDQRRGSDFSTNRPLAAVITPPTLAASVFDNNPTLRQFFVADYNQNKVRAQAAITPDSPLSAQVMGDWWRRDYKGPDCGGPGDQLLINLTPSIVFPSQCLGLQDSQGQSYTGDVQYRAPQDMLLYAFVTWSRYNTSQLGRNFTGTALAQAADPSRNWSVDSRTTDTAIGAGLTWKPEGKPYDAGIQYLYNEGVTSISPLSGPGLTGAATSTPIPDVKNTLQSLQLYGKWQYGKNVLFRANYWYQHYRSRDWAYDNAVPWSSNNVLLTGQPAPSYHANVFGVSVAYTGW
jgi:hypothetical protein